MAGSQPIAVTRRAFLGSTCLAAGLSGVASGDPNSRKPARFLFTSRGKTGLFDGEKVRYLDFQSPTQQATWQPAGNLKDGRLLLLSMEPRRDGPGRPFEEYYTQTPTHIWAYDLEGGSLQELCTKDRLAPFVTPAMILGDDRLLVQVVRRNVGQIFSVKLDGSDAREFTKAGEGLPYGLSLHPDGRRVAFHLASPAGYQVWTSDLEGGGRRQLAAKEGHLYFGTSWSPDGRHLLYVDCTLGNDPGHDWADVCIGPGHRVLTGGGSMWFAATYGGPQTRGGGSNTPAWTRDGRILFPRRLPDSKVAWEYQAQRPDVDHFNRDYKPDLARGGTEIVRLDPKDGAIAVLTNNEPPAWDFRASESPDGKSIVFCRARVGEAPAIWLMDADGTNPRLITRGVDDLGADHPRWF